MPLVNIKQRESVPGQGITKLKRREQKTVYSNGFVVLDMTFIVLPAKHSGT